MRLPYVLVSALAVASLAYLFTADVIHYLGSEKREKPSLERFAAERPPVATTRAPHLTQRVDYGDQTRPEREGPAPTRKVALRRKSSAVHQVHDGLPASPFTHEIALQSAAFKPKVDAPKIQLSAQPNPKDSHWVRELSGAGAQLRMGQQASEAPCYTYACEREPAPKDLNLAGVVVRQERLTDRKDGFMTGTVKRGNYLGHTPGVYIE